MVYNSVLLISLVKSWCLQKLFKFIFKSKLNLYFHVCSFIWCFNWFFFILEKSGEDNPFIPNIYCFLARLFLF